LRPLVAHAASLVIPARKRARFADIDRHADAETDPEIFGELRCKPAAVAERERRGGVDTDQDVVEPLVPAKDDLELVDVPMRAHQLLDAAGVDDHAANLFHVVEPPEHAALERGQGAPAGTAPIAELDDVARAVAQERHGLSIEARED